MLHFLFPSDPFHPRTVDELFSEQQTALTEAGFSTSLIADSVLEKGSALTGIPGGACVVYRGWMLRAAAYLHLVAAIEETGTTPITSPQEYLAAHYLPKWYPLVRELTPKTRVYSQDADLVTELDALGWDAFFVKDYVKSLKTSVGSLLYDPMRITELVAEMTHYRGEIEGGICVRQVEDLLPETERRYFVVDGCPYGANEREAIPRIVHTCAERIPSRFFSVDVAQRSDGVLRIVEIGDGQVSDLVGWTPEEFARIWHDVAA